MENTLTCSGPTNVCVHHFISQMGRARKTELSTEKSGTTSIPVWILENGSGKNGTDFGIKQTMV